MGSDSAHVFFSTDQPLLSSDGDASVDLYERSAGALSLATIGDPACRPGCGNGAFDIDTPGGVHLVPGGVVFLTAESLIPADTDTSTDLYRSAVGGPELLSQGPSGFNGAFDVGLEAVADDGSAVVFTTAEPLVAADTDGARDVYERVDGTTFLVSQGTSFNGEFDATSPDSTPDGSAVLFLTAEPILGADADEAVDLYERQDGTTTLVSRGTVPANGDFDVGETAFTSVDGARNVFTTEEQVTVQDDDLMTDIYMRFGNTTSLASKGSYTDPRLENHPMELHALDPRANQVVYSTQQVLTEEDRDKTGLDVWETYYEKPILTSQGPAQPLNPPADPAEFLAYVPGGLGSIYFKTAERLLVEDTDSSPDIYERILGVPKQTNPFERAVGTTKLVSQGPTTFNGAFEPALATVSPDTTRVFFTTAEPLVKADTDSAVDLYERFGGSATKLISVGAQNGNGPYDVASAGGAEVPLFTTAEQLVPGDTDSEADLYERLAGTTRLLSTAKPDPPAPTVGGSDPGTPSNVNTPSIRGAAEAGATVDLFSNPACAGPPLASGSAAQFASPGLPVAVADNSTSTFFARATDANGNPGPCSAAFAYVEDSIPGPVSLTAVEPTGPANDNAPRIRGAAEADATVRVFTAPACPGPPAALGSGAELAGAGIAVGVPDNSTTSFFTEAVDRAGNASSCAGPVSYSEDSTAPETTIESGPRPVNRSRKPIFRLGSSDAAATFVCQLDQRPSRACGRLFQTPGLRLGRHRLSVAAVDIAGNMDPTPAISAWKRRGRRVPHRPRPHRRREAGAGASISGGPSAFFGISPQTSPHDGDMRLMRRTGIGSMRFPIYWNTTEPAPGVFDWRATDAFLSSTSPHGFAHLPVIWGSPSWVTRSRHPRVCRFSAARCSVLQLPVHRRAQRRAWSEFLRELVGRYGPSGAFWELHPDLPERPIRAWQIWNEPNDHRFAEASAREYVRLLRTTAPAIRAVDGDARIVLGGLYATPKVEPAIDAAAFLARLYRFPRVKGLFDGVALHPYSRNPGLMAAAIRSLRAVMRRHGDARRDLYITEFGWGSQTRAAGGDGFEKGPQRQAEYLERAWTIMLAHRRSWRLRSAYWFTWQDIPAEATRCTFCDSSGLLGLDGLPKKALRRFGKVASR